MADLHDVHLLVRPCWDAVFFHMRAGREQGETSESESESESPHPSQGPTPSVAKRLVEHVQALARALMHWPVGTAPLWLDLGASREWICAAARGGSAVADTPFEAEGAEWLEGA